jgi:glycine cleavage system H protein
MQVPKELMYTDEHEWIKVDGERAVIGITDYAQHNLGDIVFVEVPELHAQVASSFSIAAKD